MPTEVHQHFDANGEPTGHTVVTRESAWNDETRGRALRLAEWKALSQCPCGSGLPAAECTKDQAFVVDKQNHFGLKALHKVINQEREQAKRENRPEGWDTGFRYYVKVHEIDRGGRSGGD